MPDDVQRLKLGAIYENIVDATIYIINDEKLTISSADEGFFGMLGYSKDEYSQILEDSFLNCIFAPDKRKFLEQLNNCNDNVGGDYIRLINKQAGVLWYDIKFSLLESEQGEHKKFICSLKDVTAQKNAENEYTTQKRFVELMQTSIEGGSIICYDDMKMRISYVSPELLNFLGYNDSEFELAFQGSFYNLICVKDREEFKDMMDSWLKTGEHYEVEFRIKRRDGSLVWVISKGKRTKNENGDSVLVSIITSISNTRNIIEKLEEANKDLRAMQNSIPGCFGKLALMEEGFRIIAVNQQLNDLFEEYQPGYASGRIMKYSSINIDQTLINEIALRRERSIELEIDNADKWFMIRGTFEDELYDGKYPVYYIMFTDITSQKDNQILAEIQKEKYQKITEISDDIIFEYDCVADIMVYSEKYKQLFDRPSMIFGFRKQMHYCEDEEGYVDFSEAFDSIFSGKDFYKGEYCVKINDTDKLWIEISAKGIRNVGGDTVKIIGILRDIDTRKKEQIALYDKSRIDLLSGLFNKISTQEEIVKSISSLTPGSYCALMMIDIDDFKLVNDNFGHIVGDEVIQKIAGYLSQNFCNDIIGRVGGDEFQIFISNIFDEKVIEEKADNICNGIRKMFEEEDVCVTVSVGVYCTNHTVTYESIYQKADIALYSAKSKGKNCYEMYGKRKRKDGASSQGEVSVNEMQGRADDIINTSTLAEYIKILCENRDEKEVYDKVLSLIAEEIGVDRIIINQIDGINEKYSVAFEWYQEGLKPLKGVLNNISMSDFIVFTDNVNDITAYYADDAQWYMKQQKAYFCKSGFKGVVQVPVKLEGKVIAYIEYITLDDKKVFSNSQIKAVIDISSVIESYMCSKIIKKRMFDSVARIAKLSDNECESFVVVNMNNDGFKRYVIDNGSVELIEQGEDYFNTKFVSDLSFVADDMQDEYKVHFSKDSLMELALASTPANTVEYIYATEMIGKVKHIRKMAFALDTRHDIYRYIVMVQYNITSSVIEREKLKIQRIMELKERLSAEYIFDEIMEYDVEDDKLKLLFCKDDSMLKFTSFEENYNTVLTGLLDNYVIEDDRLSMLEMLSPTNLIKYFDSNKEPIMMYFRQAKKDGGEKWSIIHIIDVTDRIGEKVFLALIRTDEDYNSQMNINSRLLTLNRALETSEEDIRNKAKFDKLTGIYNIDEFYKCCLELLKNETEYNLAMVRMDIDKFKLINDLYGYDTGDEILKHTAAVIREYIINHGVYGRMNSDIFCMCVRYKNIEEVISMIDKIVEGLSSYDAKYRLSTYFGICVIEDRSTAPSVLCDWANIALKKIKGSTLKRYAFYDNNMRRNLLYERKFESQMETALASGQFEAYLQPQYDIRTSKINGAEALVRWNHPVEGVISPARFIPLFERNGFVTKVDEFIWREACKILRRWIDDGYKPVPISVNVSRLHMFDDNLCDKIISLLNEYNLPRHLLVLEVTETVMYDDSEAMNRMLNKMRNMGFQIAMDDFGSGYSSLNMLENMCLDELKIDRAFLTRAGNSENGKVIVKFIIALAKQLNLKIVAEGVENVEQAAMLLEFGCTTAQGYFYSRPVPINKFESQAFDASMQKEVPELIKKILEKNNLE